ncbi:hypothetical protein [Streptomyces sp. OK228]|uniref:hypothetical protein n=1 Tax=Streptomyces sp. OK228 TaxID=1882786 RepID=UPI000BD1E20B|nr:hypothetical protein [Streptomyces sp. OK228]SOE28436.1 hypothetical protein SAMN05442782_5268 [Streptomyces sp. OK228]
MSVIFEYFWVADRTAAVEWAIGPGGDWLGERPGDEAGVDWFDVKRIDADVVLGKLVAFADTGLLDRGAAPRLIWPDPDEVPRPHETYPLAGTAWDTGLILEEIPETWRDALAGIGEDAVPMLALQWCDIDEMSFDYEGAAECVRDFAGLARRARAAGAQLYCRFGA